MRNIFKKKAAILLIGAMVLGPLACKDSFLDIPPAGQLAETQLASAKGVEGLLIGAYAAINGRGDWHAGATNWLWGSIRGGDANKGTNAGDFSSMNPIERFETETVNGEVNTKWRGTYEGISRANITLATLAKASDVTEANAKRISGEARFLRGHYYFELKKNFNMVPWIDETLDYGTGAEKVPNNVDIWPMIEADFKYAYDNLPETQSEVGRANKWAAGAYLGKALLFQKKFGEAKAVFDQVIANGKTSDGKKYGLVPNFGTLFRLAGENSQESVFAFQATGGAANTNNANTEYAMNMPYNSGDQGPGGCCGFFHPSFDMAASYRTTALGLPLLDNSYRTPANELKTDMGVASNQPFTPDAGTLDPRLDHTIGRRGIPFIDWAVHPGFDWIRDQSYAGPYTPKKYTYSKAEDNTRDKSGWTPGYTATNFMIIRFADVLLMAAECEVEVGSLAKAFEYVNLIRERAANPAGFVKKSDGTNAANYVVSPYLAPFASQDDARKAVRFERKLELALEGHRFYDLVRWGIAKAELDPYLAYEAAKIPSHFAGATFTEKHQYLPIPQRQIDLQGKDVLTQNPGF
jgi:starch-binding outer membrane protein, SusD/RagB family